MILRRHVICREIYRDILTFKLLYCASARPNDIKNAYPIGRVPFAGNVGQGYAFFSNSSGSDQRCIPQKAAFISQQNGMLRQSQNGLTP